MVDDLSKQLKDQKEHFIDKTILISEKLAHQETIHDNDEQKTKVE